MFRRSTKSIAFLAVLCFLGLIGLQIAWLRSAYEGESALYTKEKRQFENGLQLYLKEDTGFKRELKVLLDTYNNRGQLSAEKRTGFIALFDGIKKRFSGDNHYSIEFHEFGILQHGHYEPGAARTNSFVLVTNEKLSPGNVENEGKLCLHCILGAGEKDHESYNFQLVLFYGKEQAVIYARLGWLIAGSLVLLLLLGLLFRQILRRYRQEKKLSEAKNDFINNLSHELQTPVFAVQMANRLIREKTNNHTDIASFISIIEKETSQLKSHASKILELASLENEQIGLNRETMDLNLFIEERRPTIELMLYEKKGSLLLKIYPGTVNVSIDPVHLNNVLVSLIDNAIKYNDKMPIITITTEAKGDKSILSISDNGIGIARQYLPYVSQKFYRVPEVKRNGFTGFGLGLSYAHHIVELHDGELAIDSKVWEGTTVRIILSNVRDA